jgi:hypothetical protein
MPSRRVSSQQKIDAARANGAKSRGPKTEAGRKISSMNAVTHGFYAKGVVLANESRDEYQQMLDAYLQQFQPQGPAEFDLVEEMVAAKWRQRRLWAIETDLLEDETLTQTAKFEKDGTGYDPITPLSFAFAELAPTTLSFLNRHESRLERSYYRALKTLLQLQRLRKDTGNGNVQERTQSPPAGHPHSRKPETANQSPIPIPGPALCSSQFDGSHDTTTLMFFPSRTSEEEPRDSPLSLNPRIFCGRSSL